MEFSNQTRLKNISRLKQEKLDILVIGGGITGCGIAWDAATRGLKVGLIEKEDFASGTSSKSSKLIHGGMRYLETRQFKLVFEAVQERHFLRTHFPHLVKPLPFVFPIYKDTRVRFSKLWLGMWFYEIFAFFRSFKWHRAYGAKKLLQKFPNLKSKGLQGGFVFYDAFSNDAWLTLEIVKLANQQGAIVSNYVEMKSMKMENGKAIGVVCEDVFDKKPFVIESKHIVNATGPWTDVTRKLLGEPKSQLLCGTKGTHLVVPKDKLDLKRAAILQAKDGRFIYVIPWEADILIGTTDEAYEGSLDEVSATRHEVDYLLQAVNTYFPDANLSDKDIVSTFSGIRPLARQSSSEGVGVYHLSREHEILKDASGVFHIYGGKLTTFRKMARDMVDQLTKKPCQTKKLSNVTQTHFIEADLSEKSVQEMVFHQMAQTLCDVLMRRTTVFLKTPDQGISQVQRVAQTMAQLLGWSEARLQLEIEAYQRQVQAAKKYLH